MEAALPRRDLFVALRPVCDAEEKSLHLILFFWVGWVLRVRIEEGKLKSRTDSMSRD